jgi:hypothetical protein
VIVYRPDMAPLQVVAVLHGKRDLQEVRKAVRMKVTALVLLKGDIDLAVTARRRWFTASTMQSTRFRTMRHAELPSTMMAILRPFKFC